MSGRAKLIQLFSRKIKYNSNKDIWRNGGDNHYPERVELVIQNSPTANRARNLMSKFISGAGVVNDFDLSENRFISDVINDIAYDISTQGGFYIHRTVKIENGKLVTGDVTVMDYLKMRLGKTDDNGFGGKIWQDDYDESTGFGNTKEANWYYPFSNNQDVISAQIANDYIGNSENLEEMLGAYRGQIMYVKAFRGKVYALSPFDSVYDDCDTDYRISLYSNKTIRSGFLGKKMFLTNGLSPEDEERMEDNIACWLGAENSSNVYYANLDNAEDIEKAIHVKNIDTDFNDDMFTNTQQRIKRNILGAANNAPEALIFSNDGGLFSGSGEQLKQLKKFYSEQTASERALIERSLKMLGYEVEIKKLGDDRIDETGL